MNRRRAIVGLSVLCALCLSAFAAPGASAAGTTAGECKPGLSGFEDAHCDREKATGAFGHELFAVNTPVEVTAVNDLTGTSSPFLLAMKIAGVVIHIQCNTVSGSDKVENVVTAGVMEAKFTESTAGFSGCSVTTPAEATSCTVTVATAHATVSTPMNLAKGASTTDVTGEPLPEPVEETATGKEMGLKFTAPAGGKLTEITIGGENCKPAFFKGTFPVTGSAIATGGRGSTATSSGATGVFSKASTIKFLRFAGNPATLEGTLTFRKKGGNPLIITTTSS